VTAALLLAAAIGPSGCPALIIPGLAVECGYEVYKHKKDSSQNSGGGIQTQSSNQSSAHSGSFEQSLDVNFRASVGSSNWDDLVKRE